LNATIRRHTLGVAAKFAALGVNVVGQAKSATVPYSEVREKARQLGPLWA